jgi:hypothetical protein
MEADPGGRGERGRNAGDVRRRGSPSPTRKKRKKTVCDVGRARAAIADTRVLFSEVVFLVL